MGAPQVVYVVLMTITLAVAAEHHGERKTGEHNLPATAFAVAVNAALMWWGGFFG